MKKTPLLVILLDAFRWDYLNPDDAPYLHKLSHEGIYVKKLKASAGFCERSEIFTGSNPADSGNFTAITFDFTSNGRRGLHNYLGMLKFVDKTRISNKYGRRLISAFE